MAPPQRSEHLIVARKTIGSLTTRLLTKSIENRYFIAHARDRDEGPAHRAAQARAEPVGGVRGDPALRARGLGSDPARVARHLLPLVGPLHPGRRRRRDRRQGRRGQGDAPLHGPHQDPERSAAGPPASHDRRARRALRARHRRHYSPPERPAPLGDAREPPRRLPDALAHRDHHDGGVRRRHAQRHRLPARRPGRRRDRGRLAARPRGDAHAQRQPRLLQLAAQVQGFDHRLPGVVLVPGGQRRRVHGAPAPGDGGDRLRRAGRRRALDRPTPRHAARCVRPLARGAAGPPDGLGDLPRLGRAAAEPREGAPQVPLPPARLDRGEIPRGGRGPPRIHPRAQGARRPAGGCLP